MASASATTCPHGLLWSGDQRVSAHLTLNMEAQLDEIERIRAAVNILSQAERWPPELLFQIELVLEEVGTNIIKVRSGRREGDGHRYHPDLRPQVSHPGNRRQRQAVQSICRCATAGPRLDGPRTSDRRARRLSRAGVDGRGQLPARGRQEQGDPRQAQVVVTRSRYVPCAPPFGSRPGARPRRAGTRAFERTTRASTVFPDTLFSPLLADRTLGRDAGRDPGENCGLAL